MMKLGQHLNAYENTLLNYPRKIIPDLHYCVKVLL